MSHTPGPWEWHDPKAGEWDHQGPDLRSVPLGKVHDEFWGTDGMGRGKDHAHPPPSGIILTSWGYDADGIIIENEADARLIASAPTLLETLQALAEAPFDQPIGAWQYAIRKAIALTSAKGNE